MFEQLATPTAALGSSSESTVSERQLCTTLGYEPTLAEGDHVKHASQVFVHKPLQSSFKNNEVGSVVENSVDLEEASSTMNSSNSSPSNSSLQKTSTVEPLTGDQGNLDIRDQSHNSIGRRVPTMSLGNTSHAQTAPTQQRTLTRLTIAKDVEEQVVFADHEKAISLADVVAVAKYTVRVNVQDVDKTIEHLSRSVSVLKDHLQDGHSLYGITTGFGGSANTKTDHPYDLQRSLLQHQHSGILPVIKKSGSIHAKLMSSSSHTFMPEEWVRGAMLVRCKSLCSGYSAIRWECIETLMAMVNANLIPLVPLRGSISASGDLQPLSYIAGAMEGNPDIWVWTDDGEGGRDLIPSNVALAKAHATPCKFGPKEGLAVLNGTAFSTTVAALVVHEANQLAVLAQILTAMSVEALMGSTGSFDLFFAKVRPHEGQAEAANNIRMWLKGSSLARHTDDGTTVEGGLRQDRYSIRTASQWIGPQLEDLVLATKQITMECNSTTDNPLLDVEDGAVHHGGNFQAASVTSAMEKTRLSLQMLGRMLFQQCTELINDKTNNGLPPDLAADDHSTSYTFKGIDINVAAYASELGYLANPVSSHVQAAEMGNQGINSLALISARYTDQAIETLSSMCASHLYALCQALDLRAMNAVFLESAAREIHELTYEAFEYALSKDQLEVLQGDVVSHVLWQISKTTEKDAEDRFQYIAKSALSVTVPYLAELGKTRIEEHLDLMGMIREWQVRCSERLLDLFKLNRDEYFQNPDASKYLGLASRKIYRFIRHELKVPFHKGLVDRPSEANGLMTIGGYTSIIYEALRNGTLYSKLMGLVEEISIDGAESEAGDLKSNGVSKSWEKIANHPGNGQA